MSHFPRLLAALRWWLVVTLHFDLWLCGGDGRHICTELWGIRCWAERAVFIPHWYLNSLSDRFIDSVGVRTFASQDGEAVKEHNMWPLFPPSPKSQPSRQLVSSRRYIWPSVIILLMPQILPLKGKKSRAHLLNPQRTRGSCSNAEFVLRPALVKSKMCFWM